MKVEKTDLPDWNQAKKLSERTLERLDEEDHFQHEPWLTAEFIPRTDSEADELEAERSAIRQAERGDISPLRRRYPHLAKFLFPPKLKRGQRYPRFQLTKAAIDKISITSALYDVWRIRSLWKRYYGRKNRSRDAGCSAEEIAAKRHDLTVEQLLNAKKLRRRSPN